jgi:hypothetical protein
MEQKTIENECNEEFTHIRVYKSTTKLLKSLRIYRRETYDEVIVRIVKENIKLNEVKDIKEAC